MKSMPLHMGGGELALEGRDTRPVRGSRVAVERSAIARVGGDRVQLRQSGALAVLGRDVRVRRGGGAVIAGAKLTLERAGGETDAYLRLPPATLDTRVTEMVEEQVAQTDYRLKVQALNFLQLLAQVQEIRQGVRGARHKSGS